MVRLLVGENSFEVGRALGKLRSNFSGVAEVVDGGSVESGQLMDLLLGMSLFSEERLIIVNGLSEQKDLWDSLPNFLEKLDSRTEVVLVEPRPDKRSRTYKWLKKQAKVSEFVPLGERDSQGAVSWCVNRARDEYGFELNKDLAKLMVERIGHDQMRLDGTLQQLAVADEITQSLVDAILPLPKKENVFDLFEAALSGRVKDVHQVINYLELSEGPEGAYLTIGLLASQLINLNALVLSGGNIDKVADELKAHPYTLKRLAPFARQISRPQLRSINRALAEADIQTKTTSADPWMVVEMALIEVANTKLAK